ncbi:hypothetical protein [Mesorhizobium sp. M0589]|uniref:hypothetical protein n=1 Tax=Mesorhizobium sp. M0589 TaxID=2956965 RepID=UPI003335D455
MLALNIESFASTEGFSDVLAKHWSGVTPVFSFIYMVLTSNVVLYPVLFLSGCVFYEWVSHASNKFEQKNSKYRKWVAMFYADATSNAFKKKGMSRKAIKVPEGLILMNKRLENVEMPLVPLEFNDNEEINKIYSTYLYYVKEGDFDLAKKFIGRMEPFVAAPLITVEDAIPQSNPDIEKEKQQ